MTTYQGSPVIVKFGGSSIRDADRMQQVAKIVMSYQDKGKKPVVILSAMEGITGQLIECGRVAKSGLLYSTESIKNHHWETIKHLDLIDDEILETCISDLLNQLDRLLQGIHLLQEISLVTQDILMSFGERFSVRIFAAYLQKCSYQAQFYDAFDIGVIVKDNFHGSANCENVGSTTELVTGSYDIITSILRPVLDSNIIPIITGFIARNEQKEITTLGRGGSDLTASFIGSAMLASAIEIWTDTNGILTADPRLVENPFDVPELSFEQANELAHYGAKILHPRTIAPAQAVKIPVVVRNSFNISHPGTLISYKMNSENTKQLLVAMTLKKSVILLDIKAIQMLGQYGFLADVFAAFKRLCISIDVLATSEVSVSMTLDKDTDISRVKLLKRELKEVADVTILGERTIIALIGNKKKLSAILEMASGVLKDNDIEIEMVSLGASKINVSFVVKEQDGVRAICALHTKFFPG